MGFLVETKGLSCLFPTINPETNNYNLASFVIDSEGFDRIKQDQIDRIATDKMNQELVGILSDVIIFVLNSMRPMDIKKKMCK